MQVTGRDREDLEFFLENARFLRAHGMNQFNHLDQPTGMLNYIRMANDIAAHVPLGRVLDWGCGLGQMTWLLRRRGFDVVPFEIGSTIDNRVPDMPLTRGLDIVRASHATTLPFDAGSFDAVLSCGVLEHVDEYGSPGDELKSLDEIHRVLKPGGHLPIYMLPQQFAWQEAIARTIGVDYTHQRRFFAGEIRSMLTARGFRVQSLRRSNMVPKNLTGMPSGLRDVYGRLAPALLVLDRALSTVPGLNQLAGVLELIAVRV
ncbi:MAG TPA: class I SAM-dependent methyltransferase [Gemmatimonadaceae bacterium]